MAICVNCSIELDEGIKICPLCGKNLENNSEQERIPENYPSDIIQLHKKENRKHLWELCGIITFSGITVCTIVDLLINKSPKWSLYCDVSLIGVWLSLTIFLFAHKRALISVSLEMLTVLTTFFFIDIIANGPGWFFPVGLPVTITAFIVVITIVILYKAANFKGLNIIAASLIILSGFCIVLEMILDEFLNHAVDLRWSLITAISILPVALIFFFYHYRLKKGNRLDSFFHI